MPNHATNNTAIVGSRENLTRFLAEAFTDGQIDFEKIIPQPENIERGGCSGTHEDGVVCWYHWNVNNWGTKWNAYHGNEPEVRATEGDFGEPEGTLVMLLRFDTAWSAPTPIFQAIEEKWDVEVHVLTEDEGGFPDTEYGDPYRYYSKQIVHSPWSMGDEVPLTELTTTA